jgi:hypothetical protein
LAGAVETGNRVADEQAHRFGSALRVLDCRLWIARPGDLRELVLEIVTEEP